MRDAYNYVLAMSTMVQIRNVPDEVHSKLKERAALVGLSMSEFVLREIRKSLERPTPEELLARLKTRERVEPKVSIAALIAAEREGR